jgi:hypothetical protein
VNERLEVVAQKKCPLLEKRPGLNTCAFRRKKRFPRKSSITLLPGKFLLTNPGFGTLMVGED